MVEEAFRRYSQTRRHRLSQGVLTLDLDLSPLPASGQAEGSERCYRGRCRSKTGRKLVRVRAAQYHETIWEEVLPGRTVETLAVVQQAVAAVERLLDLADDNPAVELRRARTEWRLDSGWGSEEIINWLLWLLARGYHVTGKFKSTARVKKLVQPITAWEPTASPGREVASVPAPVPLARPCAQYAVRTPSKEKAGGYYYAVLFSSRRELGMQATVAHYDNRAAREADLKHDKRGLGLGVLRKRKLAAQRLVVSGLGTGSLRKRPGCVTSASSAWSKRSGPCRDGSSCAPTGSPGCASDPSTRGRAMSAEVSARSASNVKRSPFWAKSWQLPWGQLTVQVAA